jgi:hypothetical protein
MKKILCIVIAGLAIASFAMIGFTAQGDIWSVRNQDNADVARITSNETFVLTGTGGCSIANGLRLSGTVNGLILRCVEVFATPNAPDSATIKTGCIPDSCTGAGVAASDQPDGARTVGICIYFYGLDTCTLPAGAGVGIYGIDSKLNDTYETVTIGSKTATPTLEVQSSRAWRLIRAFVVNSTAAGSLTYTDSFSVGYGTGLGLANDAYGDTIFAYTVNGADISSSGYVTGTFNSTYDVYIPATAPANTENIVEYKAYIKGTAE